MPFNKSLLSLVGYLFSLIFVVLLKLLNLLCHYVWGYCSQLQSQTTEGEIDFYEYLGNGWGILFSHPADYTPVCTTELGKTALLNEEFAKRNIKVLAVSVDPLEKHDGWIKDINETQNTTVNFPIIADEDRNVATSV